MTTLTEQHTPSTPTLRLRRSGERGFENIGWADNWMTFSFAGYHDPEWIHFGPLRVIVENHIQPHSGFPLHPHRDVEIVTYVSSGVLTHGDNKGFHAGIGEGEMQHISAGAGMFHSEQNVHDEVEHNIQTWLIPDRPGTAFAYHQKVYTTEERQGQFRLYVSPDGEDGSMPINTDARILAGLFAPADRVNYPLAAGRGAWVQVVKGQVEVARVILEAGDGAGITGVEELDFSFGQDSEVMLFDVRMDAPLLWK